MCKTYSIFLENTLYLQPVNLLLGKFLFQHSDINIFTFWEYIIAVG